MKKSKSVDDKPKNKTNRDSLKKSASYPHSPSTVSSTPERELKKKTQKRKK